MTAPSVGGDQKTLALRLDMLNGWLFGISAARVKPELRETLICYQRECFDVLARHFGNEQPRTAYAVNPGDKLTDQQAETLRLILKNAADRTPKDKQGHLIREGWAKLKSHFKVSYREIPQSEYTEAVSLLTRHVTDWEVVDDEPMNPVEVERYALAFNAATRVAIEASQTVFREILANREAQSNRWLFGLTYGKDSKQSVPYAQPIEREAVVMTIETLTNGIQFDNGVYLSSKELADLAMACNKRLSSRIDYEAKKLAS
jgi:hypothetical protein